MALIVIGLIAGVLSGLFGIGGGVVIVPALVLLGRMAPKQATGTSLAALLLPVGALGAWQYYRNGLLDLRAATLIALGLFFGALVGPAWPSGCPLATSSVRSRFSWSPSPSTSGSPPSSPDASVVRDPFVTVACRSRGFGPFVTQSLRHRT